MKKLILFLALFSTPSFAADYVCKSSQYGFQMSIDGVSVHLLDEQGGHTVFEAKSGVVSEGKTTFRKEVEPGYYAVYANLTLPSAALDITANVEKFSAAILAEMTAEGEVVRTEKIKLSCTRK